MRLDCTQPSSNIYINIQITLSHSQIKITSLKIERQSQLDLKINICIFYVRAIIISMKNKLSRQQQNQRANLIFKYVKTLGPYSSNAEKQLYNRQNSARLDNRQQSLLLTSRVYQMSVGSNKSKKRVTFVQNEQNHSKLLSAKHKTVGHSQKQIMKASSQRVLKNQNTEQICRDLMSLQKSIYSTFNIKENKIIQTSESTILYKLPLTQSNFQEKKMELQLESKISENNHRERILQSQISKCQSQRSINNSNKYPRNEKDYKKLTFKSTTKEPVYNKNNSRQSSEKRRNSQIVNSQGIFTGISKIDKRNVSQMQNRTGLSSSRSSSYWRQQNDLMIQIFRKKLQSKFNMSPTKHSYK